MEIGIFIPIGNNGWLISTTSPQYTPSFDLNKEIVSPVARASISRSIPTAPPCSTAPSTW
jgi:hypothetical protein